ncbi:MAG: bifunctional 4-hydroxy-2-oxoglutarate aldolase/2-dehydro-3-deoxy-phosphogluconate aldolase [Salinigranum sp.]
MMSDRHEVAARIVDGGVVAVLRGVDSDAVVDVAAALCEGGVGAIEVTADTPGAMEAIAEVASSLPEGEAAVGAGTVLDAETARSAMLAGAEFVVAPTLSRDVVEVCNRYGVPVAPGVMTPTEALRAYEAGADLVKVFPAATLGPGHLESLKGPLEQIPLMPTGGVTLDNVADFVGAGAACVGVGSALVDDDAVARGDFDAVAERAREFVRAVESARE